jgi:Holliday junction resolvase
MKEREIEHKLVQAVKKKGGFAVKFVSPGYDGMPDRLVLFPGGRMAFVEVKATGCNSRPLQIQRHEDLRRLGFTVYVLDDERQIQQILDEMGGETNET